ncbi:hypothetical protein BH09BAC2_BH09BAC2_04630 [soil metagenome]
MNVLKPEYWWAFLFNFTLMKKILVALTVLICSCTTPKKITEADPEVTAAREKVPGITADWLASGKKLYIQDCSSCHFLKDPGLYTQAQLQQILPIMFVRSKITDDKQKTLITDYVMAKSK